MIEEAIQKAKKKSTAVDFSELPVKGETIKEVYFKDLSLKVREDVQEVSYHTLDRRGKKPIDQPLDSFDLKSIPQAVYQSIETKEAFLKVFNELIEKSVRTDQKTEERERAMRELSRLFNEVPYHPFVNQNYEFSNNIHAFWWNFTKEEAQQMMEKINQYTQTMLTIKNISTASQYEFESYLQMWRVLEFLNAQVTGKWLRSSSVELLIDKYQRHDDIRERINKQFSFSLPSLVSDANLFKTHFQEIYFDAQGRCQWASSYKTWNDQPVQFSEEEQKHVRLQRELISQFFLDEKGLWDTFELGSILNKAPWSHWLRPISHPGLKALFHNAVTHPHGSKTHLKDSFIEGQNTPEAFHDNPEGVFNYFIDYAQGEDQERIALTELSTFLPEDFTLEDKKRLLRLLRNAAPQIELIAFMHDSPHLMRNADVRNFFHSLFFNTSLNDVMISFQHRGKLFSQNLPSQIDQEIERLHGLIKKAEVEKDVKDVEILKSRVDTLLYYYEMKEQLRGCYLKFDIPVTNFTSSKDKVKSLLQLCQEKSELQSCLGYAARVHLRILLADHRQEEIPEILRDYALCCNDATDERNLDLYLKKKECVNGS